jgi:hypothetical protein
MPAFGFRDDVIDGKNVCLTFRVHVPAVTVEVSVRVMPDGYELGFLAARDARTFVSVEHEPAFFLTVLRVKFGSFFKRHTLSVSKRIVQFARFQERSVSSRSPLLCRTLPSSRFLSLRDYGIRRGFRRYAN